ncbi:class I SAM-dependent methyltransferase [Streptococcus pneumoniae]|uniref:C-5 cytosine-specific DNA methylase n=1 Tax=Streptococcus phage IPP66 TaxID=1916202 RepID=A0A1S5SFQ5_9CAUD|nr:DNA methyltransferase [Streptococcus pneumoniae]YP_010665045.1 C-5 cytosine-specific DNA methylase [Streptococcus phage IPP66]APD24432.1 C-5 cytosine-specific DNA methylase [Streptococcus phage IPP66]MDS3058876.1 DNA methyltransferase [Streptococcus pneumoniae]MDS5509732.1 DNA methyltransferase [Streptococcus pneumoniae]MDS5561280.1 DNA methyltransferase [Streptococcus pneumoniae]MDS5918671.1 DNA methyltransferase [Streptococcus pneumoniae]
MVQKMIVWALFDSGNGSYTKAINTLNSSGGGANIEVYPIGIDIENKNNHFIPLNLADYSRLFGDNKLFDTLDKLPHPDLIIASPPCESWSNASAMTNGNACWKKEDLSDSLFEPQIPPSMFTIRANKDYEDAYNNYWYDRQFMKRVNGELCAFNTIEIIKRYQPKYWIIENPATGRLWKYIETIIGFPLPYKNPTRYNNYDYPLQKPTKFASNLFLNLNNDINPAEIEWGNFSKSYNERSNIPQKLLLDIFQTVLNQFEKETEKNDKN